MKSKPFKDRLSDTKTPYNPEAWKAMEKQLNAAKPIKSFSILKYLNAFLVLFALSIIGWAIFSSTKNDVYGINNIKSSEPNEYKETESNRDFVKGDKNTARSQLNKTTLSSSQISQKAQNNTETNSIVKNDKRVINESTDHSIVKTENVTDRASVSTSQKSSQSPPFASNKISLEDETPINFPSKQKSTSQTTSSPAISNNTFENASVNQKLNRQEGSNTATINEQNQNVYDPSSVRSNGQSNDQNPSFETPASAAKNNMVQTTQNNSEDNAEVSKNFNSIDILPKLGSDSFAKDAHNFEGKGSLQLLDMKALDMTPSKTALNQTFTKLPSPQKPLSIRGLSSYIEVGEATYSSFGFKGVRVGAGVKYSFHKYFTAEFATTYFYSKPKVQPVESSDFAKETNLSLLINIDIVKWNRHHLSVQGGGGLSFSKAQRYYTTGVFDKSGNGLHFRIGGRYAYQLSRRSSVYLAYYGTEYIEAIKGASIGIDYRL